MTFINKLFPQAYREMKRDLRTQSFFLLGMSMAASVAIISFVVMLADSINYALEDSSGQFIASERQLVSQSQIPDEWLAQAHNLGIESAKTVEFTSMLFANDKMKLASVKAVTQTYPLKGALKVSLQNDGLVTSVAQGPKKGEIWLSPRMLSLLEIHLGDNVDVGDLGLKVSAILRFEPDAAVGLSLFAPRAMMHIDDLQKADLMGPGSRMTWHYLFARPAAQANFKNLEKLEKLLKPTLQAGQKWLSVKNSGRGISKALARAENFLVLVGSFILMMGALAVVLSAQQYAGGQRMAVAIKKTLGMTDQQIIIVESIKLGILAMLAAVLGGLVGLLFWCAALYFGEQFLNLSSTPIFSLLNFSALWMGVALSWLMAFCFALPQIAMLRLSSPMRLFRSDDSQVKTPFMFYVFGVIILLIFIQSYNNEIVLTILLSLGLFGVVILGSLIVKLALKFLKIRGAGAGSAWKMGRSALFRRAWKNSLHIQFLALIMTLISVVVLIANSFISDWQKQLPADAPNYFLINISDKAKEDIVKKLPDIKRQNGLYPVVRGRITHINDVPVTQSSKKSVDALNRSLNLTWSAKLPRENTMVSGEWWTPSSANKDGVSISEYLANRLDISMGDRLTFNVAGQTLSARIQSIRKVKWGNLRPNFYFIFQKEQLKSFPYTWMLGQYLPESEESKLDDFIREYPSITLIKVSEIINQVRQLVDSLSSIILILMYLLVIVGGLVISLLVNASKAEREEEFIIIRALGGSSQLLMRAQAVEFGVMGALAGLIAALLSEGLVQGIQVKWLGGDFQVHSAVWILLPVFGMSINILFGYLQLKSVLKIPTMRMLRR